MSANSKNVTDFKADISRLYKETELTMEKLVRWVALTLWDKITARTPVDTGRARASWNLGVGAIDASVPGEKGKSTGANKDQGSPPKDPEKKFPSIAKGSVGDKPLYITSNLDYIQYLEAGWSGQAAGGMVRISIAEVEVEIENAIKQL